MGFLVFGGEGERGKGERGVLRGKMGFKRLMWDDGNRREEKDFLTRYFWFLLAFGLLDVFFFSIL